MTGSDNVCYSSENKGLNSFDSDIKSPKLQAEKGSESANLSPDLPICEWCGESFDPSLWAPYQRLSRSGRFCDQQCACAHNGREGWKKRAHRRTCWSAAGHMTAAERNRTRARTKYLVKTGRLVIPARCTECGDAAPLETHHVDYNDPRLVLWLCHECHRTENRRQRSSVSHVLTVAECRVWTPLNKVKALDQ